MTDETESDESPDGGYVLVTSFWIDTDAYTDRDRLMFCCGAEFNILIDELRDEPGAISRVIHRENESRARMACGRFGRACTIVPCEAESDPDGTWSYLEVKNR